MFEVGDKFVIELDRKFECNDCSYYRIKGLATTMNEAQLKALDHCDEADKKEEEAYAKGYAKAMKEAQKAVRTFCVMNNEDRKRYFDGKYTTAAILDTFDPREIVEKLQLYEEEKSKIRVGDEVEINDSEVIVTYVRGSKMYVLYGDGSTEEITVNRTEIRKTGRHFGEIESLLKILKGGDDSDELLCTN